MTHIAIQASVDGTPVNGLEHVSNADYFAEDHPVRASRQGMHSWAWDWT